jgi:prolipoprotein diacylglyceryltransferase
MLKSQGDFTKIKKRKAKEINKKGKEKKMVYNISFLDHVIGMVGGRLYWKVFVRRDFCFHG